MLKDSTEISSRRIMQVSLQPLISDPSIDAQQSSNQRQISLSITAVAEVVADQQLPLNLCLVIDCSGSMQGVPLETVKQAAEQLIAQLSPHDRISVVSFDHQASVVVANQLVGADLGEITAKIKGLQARGGTSIDEGIKLGIKEMVSAGTEAISQAFVLTDGENEHGDNTRCIKLAEFATESKITLNTLGFGEHWNQNILEKIADVGAGILAYIEKPEKALVEFGRIFRRIQAVGLTNAYLQIELAPKVRLAELKPVAQVAPETIELPVQTEGDKYLVRLGDLMTDTPRVILINTYIGQLPIGQQSIASMQVVYDDPATNRNRIWSAAIPVAIAAVSSWQAQPDVTVQQYTLALAKYRQTQLAEQKLQQGDRSGAATMLQTAAKTALQMGDTGGATVLQTSATQLQAGGELSETDKKKTRIVSKTILQ
jgi:Ca-activated chloride channel homolog